MRVFTPDALRCRVLRVSRGIEVQSVTKIPHDCVVFAAHRKTHHHIRCERCSEYGWMNCDLLLQATLVNVFERYPPPPPPPPPEPVEETPPPPAEPPVHYETKFPFVPPDVQIFYEPTPAVQPPIQQVRVPTAEPRPFVHPYEEPRTVQTLAEHAEKAQALEKVPSVTEEEMKAVSCCHRCCYTVQGGAKRRPLSTVSKRVSQKCRP